MLNKRKQKNIYGIWYNIECKRDVQGISWFICKNVFCITFGFCAIWVFEDKKERKKLRKKVLTDD